MKFYFWLYNLITPWYEKLADKCKKEIRRVANAAVMKLGMEKWLWFQKYKAARTPEQQYTILDSRNPKDCSHMKGGRYGRGGRPGMGLVDYNISLHTFINEQVRARCNSCGKIWWSHLASAAEWSEIIRMVESSTNSPSKSEVPWNVNKEAKNAKNKYW